MAASQMNHSAAVLLVVVLLPVVVMEARELASAGKFIDCPSHLSGTFKGPCIIPFNGGFCKSICLAESSDNIDGGCGGILQCFCESRCTPEAVASASSAPIRH